MFARYGDYGGIVWIVRWEVNSSLYLFLVRDYNDHMVNEYIIGILTDGNDAIKPFSHLNDVILDRVIGSVVHHRLIAVLLVLVNLLHGFKIV